MFNSDITHQCGNFFLSRLSAADFRAIQPHLEVATLSLKDVIHRRGTPIQYVYFPLTCVLSVLTFLSDGKAIEVATIGNEGFSGLEAVMGSDIARDTYVCQIAGRSLRMRLADFHAATDTDSLLRRTVLRSTLAYARQMAQSVACNRLHGAEARFARWLLITHDRTGSDSFYLTHEFMADMLGVHRPTVSLIANAFQQSALIHYMRGRMTILDRAGLEAASCECYEAVAQQFDELIGLRRG